MAGKNAAALATGAAALMRGGCTFASSLGSTGGASVALASGITRTSSRPNTVVNLIGLGTDGHFPDGSAAPMYRAFWGNWTEALAHCMAVGLSPFTSNTCACATSGTILYSVSLRPTSLKNDSKVDFSNGAKPSRRTLTSNFIVSTPPITISKFMSWKRNVNTRLPL